MQKDYILTICSQCPGFWKIPGCKVSDIEITKTQEISPFSCVQQMQILLKVIDENDQKSNKKATRRKKQ